jgi:ABC-2 type transport system permease protein
MRNVIVIFKKELKSYFASPIAYLLLGIFAVIFGFFFYSAVRFFILQGMQMQMMGRGAPMDVNRRHRPLLTTQWIDVPDSYDHDASLREEKRAHRRALTSPGAIWDRAGQMVCSAGTYARFYVSGINIAVLYAFGRPDLKPILVGFLRLLLQGGCRWPSAFLSDVDEESDHCRCAVRGVPDAVGPRLG